MPRRNVPFLLKKPLPTRDKAKMQTEFFWMLDALEWNKRRPIMAVHPEMKKELEDDPTWKGLLDF